ncbi:hypothetical protein H072_7111 [Dactylellina haptotyla CBS 200.50]|uniref:Uncharacterized protein n=1 Tax=Dactylellina haptotyla (strain CBS 200.50) TaxID=1284197 RepID=S8BII2_DACHA|nr:hypothetical protein H072_7111 [Dactylellina haptotyla CBS 200.50]
MDCVWNRGADNYIAFDNYGLAEGKNITLFNSSVPPSYDDWRINPGDNATIRHRQLKFPDFNHFKSWRPNNDTHAPDIVIPSNITIILDSKSQFSFMDYDVVKRIYELLGGTCENYFNATVKDSYSFSNQKLKRYCTMPCHRSEFDDSRFEPYIISGVPIPMVHNTSGSTADWYFDVLTVPWTNDSWIPLWPHTHRYIEIGKETWDNSLGVANVACLGHFQPHPDADISNEWIYGMSVFRNAMFIFDTVGNGTIAATARRL